MVNFSWKSNAQTFLHGENLGMDDHILCNHTFQQQQKKHIWGSRFITLVKQAFDFLEKKDSSQDSSRVDAQGISTQKQSSWQIFIKK